MIETIKEAAITEGTCAATITSKSNFAQWIAEKEQELVQATTQAAKDVIYESRLVRGPRHEQDCGLAAWKDGCLWSNLDGLVAGS